jgi:predicted DNA-binding ribbon-helix-helix protein
MTIERQTVSVSIELPLLQAIENIAQNQKMSLQAILEQALCHFVAQNDSQSVRQQVLKHFNASLSKNHRLGELLAK